MQLNRLTALVALCFSLILTGFVQAQETGGVKGFVYDEETREPVIFTNVLLSGTTYGTPTDANGFYAISKVPPGDYTLMVIGIGMDTLQMPIKIEAGKIKNENLYPKQSNVELGTVTVSADKSEAQSEVRMSVVTITPAEITSIPAVGGDADFAQYLQVIPGVVSTGDQGGQLYIRGGSPIQNKILLDGMIIYNAFHSIGLFSVFDADIMRSADVYTGGFGAEYGGRISSIMDITTRDGSKKRFGGKVSLSTFGAKAFVEGPLKKPKNKNDGSTSFILSTKTSYLDQTSKSIYSYADSNGLPYNFFDIYGKISFSGPAGSKLDLFGFNFQDNAEYSNGTKLNWRNYGGGGRFILLPKTSSAIIDGNFAYSNYLIGMDEANNRKRESGISGFNMGLNTTYFLGSNEVKFGVDIVGFNTNFTFNNAFNRVIEQSENNTEIGLFFKYKWRIGKLVIDPSFRLQWYASLSQISPEPRLGLKYNLTDDIRIKAAAGMYSQNLIAANSDRDVVNLFYGFLSGPESIQGQFTDKNGKTSDVNSNLQKANHFILGAEWDILKGLTFNIEGYYKQFTQLININRNKIYDDTPENSDKPDILKKDFIVETGDAYGVDFAIKYDYKRLYLWAVYSLAQVDRWDGLQEYHPVFDRRHNVNFVAAYTFGKNLDWEVNVRYNFGSGFPFTQTQGFYEQINFSSGLDQDYTTSNGDLGIHYSEINQGRLPSYSRLDANVKKKFTLGANSILEINVGVTNALNRDNIFYFDRVTYTRVDQLPIMPNAAISLSF
ncbi:TonB-dependent receptor [bacterium SCSIO 12741]|nr:TonB-dependent receptor [bacterium SCSIO 12741]